KYVSDSFESRRVKLKEELAKDGIKGQHLESLLENRDEYTAERVFWVPPEARWQKLQNQATRPDVATLIDDAILGVERDNPGLKNKLPRDYARRPRSAHHTCISLPPNPTLSITLSAMPTEAPTLQFVPSISAVHALLYRRRTSETHS